MQTVIHKIDKQQRVTVNAVNYIQYLIKTYNVKNLKYIYICESFCYRPESNWFTNIVHQLYINKKKCRMA